MGTQTRHLRLGEIHVEGPDFDFEPGDGDFSLRRGEEARVGVAYSYVEVSTAKETVTLGISVEVDGLPPMRLEHPIHDRPLHQDDEMGMLSFPVRFGSPGTFVGRFTVRASYASDRKGAVPVRHERSGEFRVRVQ